MPTANLSSVSLMDVLSLSTTSELSAASGKISGLVANKQTAPELKMFSKMNFNWLAHADMQHQDAASPLVLPAGGRQRY